MQRANTKAEGLSVQEQNWWWWRISKEVEKLKAKARVGRVGRVGRVEGGKSECRSCLFSGAASKWRVEGRDDVVINGRTQF